MSSLTKILENLNLLAILFRTIYKQFVREEEKPKESCNETPSDDDETQQKTIQKDKQ